MDNLVAILLLILLGWFWLDSLRAKEFATGICSAACKQRGLQFLDQTVALRHLRVHRTFEGLRFRRVYRFDFSEQGAGRRSGHLVLLGLDLEEISFGLPERPRDA